jgi:hypothetical protein
VPRLCEFYHGICLKTEKKARKTLSQGKENLSHSTVYILPKTPTHYKALTNTHKALTNTHAVEELFTKMNMIYPIPCTELLSNAPFEWQRMQLTP